MPYEELPPSTDMPACFHLWLEDLEDLEEKSPKTVKAYGQALRRVVHFAEVPPSILESPDKLDQVLLTNAVRRMRRAERRVSMSTLNQTLAALGSYFDWCTLTPDGGEPPLLIGNPPDLKRIRRISKIEQGVVDPEYYRPAELQRLFGAAATPSVSRIRWPERDLAMCGFLAVLGLRASELTGATINWLTEEALDEKEGSSTWMLQVLGKGRKHRHLPLSDALTASLKRWGAARLKRVNELRIIAQELEDSGHDGPSSAQKAEKVAADYRELADRLQPASDMPLFVPTSGARLVRDSRGKEVICGFTYRQLRYWVERLNREAGLRERSPHALRHTAGVQLAVDRVPMNVIQALLGHASVATTGIYTELAGGELVGILDGSEANRLLGRTLSERS
jgi:site-specific recombinase XerD